MNKWFDQSVIFLKIGGYSILKMKNLVWNLGRYKIRFIKDQYYKKIWHTFRCHKL